jgi:hypothetical protein
MVVERWARLCQALAILFVLSVGLSFVPINEGTPVAAAIVLLLQLLVHTLFAVTTHRVVLTGPDSVPTWGLNRWTQRETLFVLYLLGLSLIVVFTMGVATILPPLLIAPVVVLVAIAFSSLSLVFPAVAIGEPMTLPAAWKLAEGHRLLMVATVFLFPLLLAMPLVALAALSMSVLGVLSTALQALITVFTITALSVAYAEINRVEGAT